MTEPAEWELVQSLTPAEEWRHEQLTRAGADYCDAVEIARDPTVDLHRACRLLEQGCESWLVQTLLTKTEN